MKIETKGFVLAAVTSASLLALSFGLASILRSSAGTTWTVQTRGDKQLVISSSLENQAKQGHELFERNCSHCHGDDARGGEGPSLYDLTLSDGRISKKIKEGIKGEMPKFGGKFTDADITALIAYVRTLKD